MHLLITAGPTHEPIDAVRYIGNRSSGKLGIAIAREATERGHHVTLLLGPVCDSPVDAERLRVMRFTTAHELEQLLRETWPRHDVLIMAAAVADYRPKAPAQTGRKIARSQDGLMLELETTADLVAAAAQTKRDDQIIIGFALEPADRMEAAAREKLVRKNLHAIVANSLATMDAATIDGIYIERNGNSLRSGLMEKPAFAAWLLDCISILDVNRVS
ncbi:MAG: phosphopantothenoylcysteine decarboxylase [Phycisphaerales bacterium]